MTMSVMNYALNTGDSLYYDPDFRLVLETHMNYLRSHPDTRTIAVDAKLAYKYEHDLSGLLSEVGIGLHLHFIIMRMNNLDDPRDFTLANEKLLIPSEESVQRIARLWNTRNKRL